ncbi:MAG: DNA polymerase ligase N-terminal domain-containing protein [Pirellulaceae bacterium]
MPRYVILRHETASNSPRPTHWDLMLETGSVLATWALDALPVAGNVVAATRLADHRSDYLAYEGPISENRGSVARWDEGQYGVESQTVIQWRLTMRGNRLDGILVLRRVADELDRWTVWLEAGGSSR